MIQIIPIWEKFVTGTDAHMRKEADTAIAELQRKLAKLKEER